MVVALTTAERADLALVVAIVSAAFTLGALIWEIVRHWLSGARIDVRLRLGILTETSTLIRHGPGRYDRPSPGIAQLVGKRPWIEAAIITVTNYGRTPVSVTDIALDFGRQPGWRPSWRHTVAGFPVEIHQGSGQASSYRIEPHDSVTVIYDLWALVDQGMKGRTKLTRVGGSAIPAGHRNRPKRSSRRHRMEIRPGQRAIWTEGPDHPLTDVFRAVWRAMAFKHPEGIYDAWIGVSSLLMDYENGEPPHFLNPDRKLPNLDAITEELSPPLERMNALWQAGLIRMAMPRGGQNMDSQLPPGASPTLST